MINIAVPMAGAGSRFRAEGYEKPKPFIDVGGRMMIERVLDGLACPGARLVLIIRREFEEKNRRELDLLAERYRPEFVSVARLTQGACCTALAAREIVGGDDPVVFADSDNVFDNRVFRAFVADCLGRGLDGSLLTFDSSDPCYSYAAADERGLVTATREKEPISRHAVAGAYMFRRGRDFVKCAVDMLIYGDRERGEFYLSGVYNYAVAAGLRIGFYDIAPGDWACLGTPRQLREYAGG